MIIPSVGYLRSYLIYNEPSDYCFYYNQLSKQDYQTINYQVKLYNNSVDYFVYVWYSNDQATSNQTITTNMTGTYDLNTSSSY